MSPDLVWQWYKVVLKIIGGTFIIALLGMSVWLLFTNIREFDKQASNITQRLSHADSVTMRLQKLTEEKAKQIKQFKKP
jgi:hypothetical protein